MNGASCLLNVGRVVSVRDFFGASCLGASCLWGELSDVPYNLENLPEYHKSFIYTYLK